MRTRANLITVFYRSWDGIAGDVECQKALVAKLLGYLLILGSLTVKAPQVCVTIFALWDLCLVSKK